MGGRVVTQERPAPATPPRCRSCTQKNMKGKNNNMKKELPLGVALINLKDDTKTIHAKLPFDSWYAKRLARRFYRNAMTTLAAEYEKRSILFQAMSN